MNAQPDHYTLGFAMWLESLVMGNNPGYQIIEPPTAAGPLFATVRVRNPVGEVFHITIERCV